MTRITLVAGGMVHNFQHWDDSILKLPVEEVLAFVPDIPPAPHTDAQHAEIAQWHGRFSRLMAVARAHQCQP